MGQYREAFAGDGRDDGTRAVWAGNGTEMGELRM